MRIVISPAVPAFSAKGLSPGWRRRPPPQPARTKTIAHASVPSANRGCLTAGLLGTGMTFGSLPAGSARGPNIAGRPTCRELLVEGDLLEVVLVGDAVEVG